MPAEGTISANNQVAPATVPATQVFDGHFLPQECLSPELNTPDYDRLLSQINNSWHAGSAHLSRSPSGLWYMRLKVPDDIRAAHPHLPKELRRSTKTRHKIHALAISRKMCLDFLIRHKRSEKYMGQPDHQLPPATQVGHGYTFTVVDNKVHVHFASAPDFQTMQQATRCMQALQSALAANDANFSAAENQLAQPLSPPQREASPALTQTTAPYSSPSPVVLATEPEPYDPNAPQWLSDAIHLWRRNGPHLFTENTWEHFYKPSFRILREIIGTERRTITREDGTIEPNVLDIPMREISSRHIAILHASLKQLPPNQGANTAVVEALVRIKQRERQGQPLPTASSVEKKLGHLLPFFRFAKESKWLSPDVLDAMQLARKTASTHLVKSQRKKGGKVGYVALSQTELQRVFRHHAFKDDCYKNPWKFWVPMLCLYQGVRVSEASQLYTDDILLIQGVPCLSFIEDVQGDLPESQRQKAAKSSEDHRRLKTTSSRRVVPLHPTLIEMGFLAFVDQVKQQARAKAAHLFKQLSWDEKHMFGRRPSRFIIHILREVDAHIPRKKVAHSLRSNFNQELQRTMIPSDLISRMLGHTTGKIEDERYNENEFGPALPFAEIVPYLKKMDFEIDTPSWTDLINRGQADRVKR